MKKTLLFAASMSLLFAACKKDDYAPIGYEALRNAYRDLETQPTRVVYAADQPATIVGPEGCIFKFPANCWVTDEGDYVTGNVQILIKEYLKREDMLFSRVLPTAVYEPLLSGGEIFVQATQGGQKLVMADPLAYTIQIPQKGKAEKGMELFFGENKPEYMNATNMVNWIRNNDPVHGLATLGNDTITIVTDTTGYIAANQYQVLPEYQGFQINITGIPITNNDNIQAYAVYDGHRAVWPMLVNDDGVIKEKHVPNVPVHFVIIAESVGTIYGGIMTATPTEKGLYEINLQKIDPASFKKLIAQLP